MANGHGANYAKSIGLCKEGRLQNVIRKLGAELNSNIACGCRLIRPTDEAWLRPAENERLRRSVPSVRRASGAARAVARRLLVQVGVDQNTDLVSDSIHGPNWPMGICGSMTHDAEYAAAAVISARDSAGIGIDIEPAKPLPSDIYEVVVTDAEHTLLNGNLLTARSVFTIKEAVYKATHPIDGVFLNHEDVEIDFNTSKAHTSTGYELPFVAIQKPRMVAIALLPKQ